MRASRDAPLVVVGSAIHVVAHDHEASVREGWQLSAAVFAIQTSRSCERSSSWEELRHGGDVRRIVIELAERRPEVLHGMYGHHAVVAEAVDARTSSRPSSELSATPCRSNKTSALLRRA